MMDSIVPNDRFIRFMLLLAVVGLGMMVRGMWSLLAEAHTTTGYGLAMPRQSGPELIAVYIGSSNCIGSKLPGFREVEQRTLRSLAAMAGKQGMRFVTLGVSVDASVEMGDEYLKKFGPFDIKLSGGGWLNPGAISYLWRDVPGEAEIPQIVVIRREVRVHQTGVEISADSLLGRLIGMGGMKGWLLSNPTSAIAGFKQ